MDGILLVVSGPSGSGKGSILKKLCLIEDVAIAISATTRKIRDGEVNGREYFFLTREEFLTKIEKKEMLEYNEYCGNLYGTMKSQVKDLLSKKEIVVLEIDVNGAFAVKKEFDVVLIFVVPPSLKVLKNRLKLRKTETAESLKVRLKQATEEIKFAAEYDYVVVNNSIDLAVEQLRSVIVAEKLKASRQLKKINFEN